MNELFANEKSYKTTILNAPYEIYFGRVTDILGLMVEVAGLEQFTHIGSWCQIQTPASPFQEKKEIFAEIVGYKNGRALLMPFDSLDGVGIGARVDVLQSIKAVYPCNEWKGRILNSFAQPIDQLGPIPQGSIPYMLKNAAPAAHLRDRVQGKFDLGVRAINTFLTCCKGQRLGIFSGSGVGKSILMSMLCRYAEADVNVIGLIGERGREVQEFIQDDLGEEGLKKTILVVSTSDDSALKRKQAAYLTMSIAEYFRDQGKNVLCMMDSLTRFAMAQREIGLSVGEPPTTKGYPPTVYSELPKLLERAGPGEVGKGSITAFFTVLVEGDDHNEPISDTVRGIVDGHIVLERSIADRGRYPAINILKSVSRMMPQCNNEEENLIVKKARRYLALYEDMADMIRLGAYKKGSDPEIDEAIFYTSHLEGFLSQDKHDYSDLASCYQELKNILSLTPGPIE